MESDPDFRSPQPVHRREELVRSFKEAWLPPKPMGMLAAVYKPEGRFIGRGGLYPCHDEHGQAIAGEASLGFYIARPYWGRGLATEAATAFVERGFQDLGLRRIEAGVNALNLASIRVLEKAGFMRIATGSGGGSDWNLYEIRP